MKKTLTTLLMLCLYLGAFAQKDIAYWNKMANGTSEALIKHFWGASFKGYEKRYYFNYGSDLSDLSTNNYWRRHPDLNRGIRVLQTRALPLGYVAILYYMLMNNE